MPVFGVLENHDFSRGVSRFVDVAYDCGANVNRGIYGDKQFHSVIDLERLF